MLHYKLDLYFNHSISINFTCNNDFTLHFGFWILKVKHSRKTDATTATGDVNIYWQKLQTHTYSQSLTANKNSFQLVAALQNFDPYMAPY